ncbi:MAG: prepilin-type N-terminal cleavage/methylation domain-containing protein [Bryobacteraceae bacterium]|nr:prepilin-type N-terminal cleavage/methylation domain-containing protein [Bryobacteraceae bacterium]
MKRRRGVTLVEMLIVVSLLGLMVGISFPAVTAGIDSLRLASASDSLVSFLNGALNRADRRQEVVEVEIAPKLSRITLRSTDPSFTRTLNLPDGVTIRSIFPELPVEPGTPRYVMLYPAGAIPRIGIELQNRRGARRIVRVDPITGVPQVELVAQR